MIQGFASTLTISFGFSAAVTRKSIADLATEFASFRAARFHGVEETIDWHTAAECGFEDCLPSESGSTYLSNSTQIFFCLFV